MRSVWGSPKSPPPSEVPTGWGRGSWPVVVDGKLYFADAKGVVYAFEVPPCDLLNCTAQGFTSDSVTAFLRPQPSNFFGYLECGRLVLQFFSYGTSS